MPIFNTNCFIIRFQLQMAFQKQQKTQENASCTQWISLWLYTHALTSLISILDPIFDHLKSLPQRDRNLTCWRDTRLTVRWHSLATSPLSKIDTRVQQWESTSPAVCNLQRQSRQRSYEWIKVNSSPTTFVPCAFSYPSWLVPLLQSLCDARKISTWDSLCPTGVAWLGCFSFLFSCQFENSYAPPSRTLTRIIDGM